MPKDAIALAVLCDSEIAKELVADGKDIKDETFPDTAGDETESTTLDEFGVTPRDAVKLAVLCVNETAKELVADDKDIKDETFADTAGDETESATLDEFGVTPRDAVKLAVLCDNETAKELVADVTRGGTLDESDVRPTEAGALIVLWDCGVQTQLVTDCFDIEYETFGNASDDDETEVKMLVKFSVTPTDAVGLAVLGVAVKVENLANILEDDEYDVSEDDRSEGRTLAKVGIKPSDTGTRIVVWDSETHTQLVTDCFDIEDEDADGVDIEFETFADT